MEQSALTAFRGGRYEEALTLWQRELEGAKEEERACILFNIGLTYRKMGRVTDALRCYQEAASMQECQGDACLLGKSYMGMGVAYRELNDIERAISCTEQAMGIFERLGERDTVDKLKENAAHLRAEAQSQP